MILEEVNWEMTKERMRIFSVNLLERDVNDEDIWELLVDFGSGEYL